MQRSVFCECKDCAAHFPVLCLLCVAHRKRERREAGSPVLRNNVRVVFQKIFLKKSLSQRPFQGAVFSFLILCRKKGFFCYRALYAPKRGNSSLTGLKAMLKLSFLRKSPYVLPSEHYGGGRKRTETEWRVESEEWGSVRS